MSSGCEAVGCSRSTYLTRVHQGWFCPRHAERLSFIRYQIRRAFTTPRELYWRHKEAQLRGLDPGHATCMSRLSAQVQAAPLSRPRQRFPTIDPVPPDGHHEPIRRVQVMAPGLIFVS